MTKLLGSNTDKNSHTETEGKIESEDHSLTKRIDSDKLVLNVAEVGEGREKGRKTESMHQADHSSGRLEVGAASRYKWCANSITDSGPIMRIEDTANKLTKAQVGFCNI